MAPALVASVYYLAIQPFRSACNIVAGKSCFLHKILEGSRIAGADGSVHYEARISALVIRSRFIVNRILADIIVNKELPFDHCGLKAHLAGNRISDLFKCDFSLMELIRSVGKIVEFKGYLLDAPVFRIVGI